MKKIQKLLLLMLLMTAVSVTAAAQVSDNEAVLSDAYWNWYSFVNYEDTVPVTGNITSPYEYEQEEITSALKDYTFNFDKYFMSHNLYEILRLGENGGKASFTYVLDSGCSEELVSIKKLENDEYVLYKNYKISSLYSGASFSIDGKSCILYAYNTDTGYICVNLSIYDSLTEPMVTARYDVSSHRVTVSGTYEKWYDYYVNMALVRKDSAESIGYIDQERAANGSVMFDFKFAYDPADYLLVINCNGKRYEYGFIEVVDSGAVSEATISLHKNEGSVSAVLEANEIFYSVNNTSYITVVFYDENGNMISCDIAKCWQDDFEVVVPEGGAKAKTFAIESLETINPQTGTAEEAID